MGEVRWVKLYTDMFDNKKIKQIKQMPEGKAILLIWIQLIVLAGSTNDNGAIYFTKEIAYTEEMLATQFDEKIEIVRGALNLFSKFGMIELVDNIIYLSNWEKYQNIDGLEKIREQNRTRVSTFRAKQKQLQHDVTLRNVTGNVTSNVTVTQCNDIDIELDKELDIRKNNTPIKQPYGEFENVLLTEEEHKKVLARKYGDKAIEKLSAYLASKKTNYKSHYAVLNSWVFNSVEEEEMKKTKFTNGFQKEIKTPHWYDKYEKELKDKNRPKEKVSVDLEALEKSLDETFKTQK